MNKQQKDIQQMLDKLGLSKLTESASDNLGLNKLASNKQIQQLKLASGLGRSLLLGNDGLLSPVAAEAILGVNLGTRTLGNSKQNASSLKDAQTRRIASSQKNYNQAGIDNTMAGINSAKNMSKIGMNQYALASIGLPTILDNDISKNMMGMSLGSSGLGLTNAFGGASGLGNALGIGGTGALATGGGMAAMMAATMAGSKISSFINDKSSTTKIATPKMTTHYTSYSDLTDESGTSMLQNTLSRLQNAKGVSPAEGLMISSLIMIYGAVSASAAVAADIRDSESKKNKEGAGSGHNALGETFGWTGDRDNYDQLNNTGRKRSATEKFFQFLESGTAQLVNTYDPITQISNLLSGQSSTKLSNEASINAPLLLKSERDYGKQVGLSTSAVQTLNMSAAQVLGESVTYEDSVIRLLGWIGELNRHSGEELTTIRNEGIGIGNSSKFGHSGINSLSNMKMINEMENMTTYKAYFQELDEMLGYIPGWNMISGSAKIGSKFSTTLKDYFGHELDENGNKLDSKFDQTEFNPIARIRAAVEDSFVNESFKNDEDLKKVIGAEELSAQEKMSIYLGENYPDRFEQALVFLHNIQDATVATANATVGRGYRKTKHNILSQNNITGQMGDENYHNSVFDNIKDKLFDINTIRGEGPTGLIKQLFSNFIIKDEDSMLNNIFDKRAEKSDLIQSIMGNSFNTHKKTSVQDIQDEKIQEERQEKQLTVAEKQLIVLEDIRKCFGCEIKDLKGNGPRRGPRDVGNDGGFLTGGLSIDIDSKSPKSHKSPKSKLGFLDNLKRQWKTNKSGLLKNAGKGLIGLIATIAPRLLFNPWVMGAIAAGVAGYWLYNKFQEISGNDIEHDTNQRRLEGQTKITDEDHINTTLDRTIKLYESNKKTAYRKLDKMSTGDLYALKKEIDDGWFSEGEKLLPAIKDILIKRKNYKGFDEYDQDDIFSRTWYGGTDFKNFDNDKGLEKLRDFDVETLKQIKKVNGKNMSKNTRNQLDAAILYKMETQKESKDLTGDDLKNYLSDRRGAKMNTEINALAEKLRMDEEKKKKEHLIAQKKREEDKKDEMIKKQTELLAKLNNSVEDAYKDNNISEKERSTLLKELSNSNIKDTQIKADLSNVIQYLYMDSQKNLKNTEMITNMLSKLKGSKSLSNELMDKIMNQQSIKQ